MQSERRHQYRTNKSGRFAARRLRNDHRVAAWVAKTPLWRLPRQLAAWPKLWKTCVA